MARDIDWKMKRDDDGSTYEVRVVRFSGKFKFQFLEKGAARWEYDREPARADLEYFVDLIQRRYRRREATWKEVQMAEALLKALGRREAEEAAALLRLQAGGGTETTAAAGAPEHAFDLTEAAEEILEAGPDGDGNDAAALADDFQDVSAAFAAPTAIETIKEKLKKAAEEEDAPTSPKLTKVKKDVKKAVTELKPPIVHSEPPPYPLPPLTEVPKKPAAPKKKLKSVSSGPLRTLAAPLASPAFIASVKAKTAAASSAKPKPKPASARPKKAEDLSPARVQALAQARAIAKPKPQGAASSTAAAKSGTSPKPRKRAP